MTQFQMTPADVERAREIVAVRVVGKSDELPERIVLAVAQGIAEGRALGIQQGIKLVTASNDP
jgi:hypothetical protein